MAAFFSLSREKPRAGKEGKPARGAMEKLHLHFLPGFIGFIGIFGAGFAFLAI
jgi:hypothetical protein